MSIYDTKTMLAALRTMKQPRTFLRDTFFRNVKTFNSRTVEIDIRRGKRRVAVFVGRSDPGHVSERIGYTTNTYQPPYIKEKRPLRPGDVMTRSDGQTVYSEETPAERAQGLLADDLNELNEMITRREELMAREALFEGKNTYRDANEYVDFGVSNTHKLAGISTGWDVDGGKPLDDIADWTQLIAQDSGLAADTLVLGKTAARKFLGNPQISGDKGGVLSSVKVQRGEIAPKLLPNGVVYYGFIPECGVDVYGYFEWYIDPADDTEKAMVPDNGVLLGCSSARMDRLYGVIEDVEALYAVPRFPKSWVEQDPSARFLMLQSAPLLVPHDVESFVTVASILD